VDLVSFPSMIIGQPKMMKTDLANKAGFTGGMITSLFANIYSYELLKSALLAAVGTIVSFGMTKLLQRLVNRKTGKKS
jgi:hypothetical protein